MFKKTLLSIASAAALLGAAAAPAFAASSFYLVVPIPKTAKAPVEDINMVLTGTALPSAKVDHAYSENMHPYLSVTGDPASDPTMVRWSVVGGALPAGLSLDPVTGVVSGTPTEATTSPASFTLRATYRGKDGQADYSIEVALNLEVNLAGATLPKATVNQAYTHSLQDYLDVTGDPSPDKTAASWSLAEGSLPAGLTLDEDTGQVTGTPTSEATSSASFTVLATYKGADGQAVYTIEVGGQVLKVKQITAGDNHTCAITQAGGVKCWGSNSGGELGDGSTTNSSTPVDVVGLSLGVSSISAGTNHTCAVVSGAAKCWGENSDGQLGNGNTTQSSTPVAVLGLSSGVASISTKTSHTCSVVSGAAKCWGRNDVGQLGSGSTTSSSTPVAVVELSSGVSSISAGEAHTCAVVSGAAKCWGTNDWYQLGDGTATNSSTPMDVVGLSSGVSSISAGEAHTCAVTTSGAAKCWGANLFGELGDDSSTPRSTPVAVIGLSSGVSSISTGVSHTCAVVSGAAKCWGANYVGQLGDYSGSDSSTPVDVVGLSSGVSSISAGGYHTCAVVSGAAKCWGNNDSGKLGDNSTTSRLTPVDVIE